MRYTYKIRELGLDKPIQDMQAMSFKKLRACADVTTNKKKIIQNKLPVKIFDIVFMLSYLVC